MTRFLITLLGLCATASWASSMMRGEFLTMQRCLAAIQSSSGQRLNIVTDKPEKVMGTLSDGRFFSCKKVQTGSKGTYFEGVFDSKDK